MLDLKQMEEAVDALLAKETEESMFNWLLTKRYPGLMEFLGGGTVQELESIATITDKKISPPNYSNKIRCVSFSISLTTMVEDCSEFKNAA